ncbi:hypothetical protein PABG_04662 [Paracoccidioides brasiliensis Pb03]|nr:hypothetical protein PABG_04662 [Paracoccidioides brasiliensis Pb03]
MVDIYAQGSGLLHTHILPLEQERDIDDGVSLIKISARRMTFLSSCKVSVRGRREMVNVRNVLPIIDDQSWEMDCHSASRSRVASREGNLRASKVRSTLIALAKWWGTYRYRSRRRGRGRICRKPPLKPAA